MPPLPSAAGGGSQGGRSYATARRAGSAFSPNSASAIHGEPLVAGYLSGQPRWGWSPLSGRFTRAPNGPQPCAEQEESVPPPHGHV